MADPIDIVVAGGGMVGSAFAAALADSPLQIHVINAHSPSPWQEHHYDTRVSAINLASESILSSVDSWQHVRERRVAPFREIQVSDQATGQMLCFDAADSGLAHLGHIVENSAITDALRLRLEAAPNVTVSQDDRVQSVNHAQGQILVNTEQHQVITARLLVGADGATSTIRALSGISFNRAPYGQTALVSTVTTREHHGDIARQRFLPTGPIAFLPLADGRCSIVWSADSAYAEKLMAMTDSAFLAELNTAFPNQLEVTSATPRQSFILEQLHASTYCVKRIALIGDAAHTLHPLAGLGVNLGLLDAASLAETILHVIDRHRDIGGVSTLRRYERWRKGENTLALATIEGIHQFFQQSNPLAHQLRAAGMSFCQHNPFINRFFVHRATGLSGDLPRAARYAET